MGRKKSAENLQQWVFGYGGEDGGLEILIRPWYSNPSGYCSYKIADICCVYGSYVLKNVLQ